MRAATSENVQPLALIACEKFGATLAMCPETNKKMEDLIIKVSGPRRVRFMKAQIGYSANDSATQLSGSLAGIQFLGLAAALTSCMDAFAGANALSEMLTASASDKTLLPTSRQLKDLMGVIEHRLVRSGFADIWVGYEILLSSSLRPSADNDYCEEPERLGDDMGTLTSKGPKRLEDFMEVPSSTGISNLIEAFRQLNRLGDATTITIRASSCAAWVIAFTRWCLGVPPSIILAHGKAPLDQPKSQITLFLENRAKDSTSETPLEISIHRSIHSPADLLRSESCPRSPDVMITVECFGRKMCHAMGGENAMAYRAMCEILPYVLKQSCELLRLQSCHEELLKFKKNFRDMIEENHKDRELHTTGMAERLAAKEKVARHRAQPFPDDDVISSVLTEVLSLRSQQYPPRLGDQQILDLPLVHQHVQNLKTSCLCKYCDGSCSIRPHKQSHYIRECKKMQFLSSISFYAAAILAISLFENPAKLLISLGSHSVGGFEEAIDDIITSGEPAFCHHCEILARALIFIGHKKPDPDNWVISCYKGQAVYPRVFETEDICHPGFLALYWAPGSLVFDGEVYDRGIGCEAMRLETNPLTTEIPRTVTAPLNLYPSMKMEWKVIRRDGFLEIYPTCRRNTGRASSILTNLANALVLLCPHDRALPLRRPDPNSRYFDLFLLVPPSPIPDPGVKILAVDGNPDLRMFAISLVPAYGRARPQAVIRDNACLQCCLDLCREFRCGYLVC